MVGPVSCGAREEMLVCLEASDVMQGELQFVFPEARSNNQQRLQGRVPQTLLQANKQSALVFSRCNHVLVQDPGTCVMHIL